MTNLQLENQTYVIVTTGEEARVFRECDEHGLRETDHWTVKNILEEGPSGQMPPDMSQREIDEAVFSKQLSEKLYVLAHSGKMEHLILAADPDTLGEIRPQLHKEVTDILEHEIDKTLIHESRNELRDRLEKLT